MQTSKFEELLQKALNEIPQSLRNYLDEVELVVEDVHDMNELGGHMLEDGDLLMGMYEGVSLSERLHYTAVLPDKITLFHCAIQEISNSDDEIIEQIKDTVIHEVIHHFGIEFDQVE